MAKRGLVRSVLSCIVAVSVILTTCTLYLLHDSNPSVEDHQFDTVLADHPRNKLQKQTLPIKGSKYHRQINRVRPVSPLSSDWDHFSIYPPFSNSENLHNIDFNIERLFTFGNHSVGQTDTNGTHVHIPRIIHMIWTNEYIPAIFANNVKSCVSMNPNWMFYFWTLRDGEKFVNKHYPNLRETYRLYLHDVSRSDALRYMALYHYGGIYFDMDTECLHPLDNVIENEECILSPEPMEHAHVIMNMRSLLGTAALACRPKHELFRYIIDMLVMSSHLTGVTHVAGPMFLTDNVKKFIKKNIEESKNHASSIHIVSHELFLDLIKSHVADSLSKTCSLAVVQKTNNQTDRMKQRVCRRWLQRGGKNRTVSPRAVTVHSYFGSYNSGQESKLIYKEEHRIDNLIPSAMRYPFS